MQTMISYLEGVAQDGSIIIEHHAGKVGYEVKAAFDLPEGQNVSAHISSHTRDKGTVLYAFASRQDKAMFEALCNIDGIGATTALNAIRHLGAGGIAAAKQTADNATLIKVPGLGAKAATRIISDLKIPAGVTADSAPAAVGDDLLDALVSLGMEKNIASRQLAAARQENPGANEADLLAAALAGGWAA